jgi:hypothetical protein
MINQPPKPNTNLLTMVLFSMTSVIYVANAIYLEYYTKDPDHTQFGVNIALAVMWFCIGWSFSYTPPTKK